jgi:hypothetical protein
MARTHCHETGVNIEDGSITSAPIVEVGRSSLIHYP